MDISKYKEMIQDFVDKKITIKQFEKSYLEAFSNQTEFMNVSTFKIFDNLFAWVDAYWEGCLPGQETNFTISEQLLREKASQALLELKRSSIG